MSNYDDELDMDSRNSLSLIINRIAKSSTVLEFGPANGRMTKYLKETLGCNVYAVELDKEAAKDAAPFCEDMLVADIEKFKWLKKYQHIEFDYIIFADVLEHLYDPQAVLTKAKTLLKADGSVLMSLPNIAHNAIIMDLLNDKFTYRKTGLLDNTHIRFFTKNTLEELVTSCGLEIAFETASYVEPSNTEFKNSYTDLDDHIAKFLRDRDFGEVYQFIFEAKLTAPLLEIDFFLEDLASLYIDTGKGFNELEKVTITYNSQSDKTINFTLEEGFNNVTAVRIDPLEMDLSLKVKNLIVNGIDETNNINHNGITTDSHELKFLNNDPQLSINLDVPVTLKSVVLEYEYLTRSYTTKDDKIELYAQTVKNQEKQLQDKDNHLEKQAQDVEELNMKIFNLEEEIQSMRLVNRINRFFGVYRATEFFRKDLPNEYSLHFDSAGYLKANPDVAKAVDDGVQESAATHFCEHGFDEILRGGRKLLENIPFYNDEDYKNTRTDVTKAIDDGSFKYSHFVHYLLHGHKENLKQNKWKILKHIKNKPGSVKLGIQVLKNQGLKVLIQKIKRVNTLPISSSENKYKYIEPELTAEIKNELEGFVTPPLISIIMPVYNVDPKWLELAIKSIENQWYENWELCIVDDKSTNKKTVYFLNNITSKKIKVKYSEQNGNISVASNEGLSIASGDYVALMDNDDELTPDALYEAVKVINSVGAEFIYSDEDKLELDGTFSDPHFKPDFAPDMFLSQNYLSHLGIIKKELIDKVNGFTVGLEGAQDYDLYLKVLEHTDKIHHIQKVLYHWRKIPGSTAAEFGEKSYAQEAGRKSLENAIKRRKIDASVENGITAGTYKVNYAIVGEPLVSIIIPFKDKPELLTMCIESILDKTTYQNWEIIGISNNSEEKATFAEMDRLQALDDRIHFHEYNIPFNYSAINNFAVNEYAKGEHVLLLNNDIEIITPEWIEAMLQFSQRENTGCVGAKLYYPNDTIQHAGVIIGLGGLAGHSYKYFPINQPGYFKRLILIQNFSAVTAACLMIKKSIFEEVKGLNEQDLKIAFNDVDFCLRVREAGYLNVFTPYCEAYHHESVSRGLEDTEEKKMRFKNEVEFVRKRHNNILENGDPYYNPNLTLDREAFSYAQSLRTELI